MRIAFKLAYIGTKYSGFQIQPGFTTIESAIFKALTDTNIIESPQRLLMILTLEELLSSACIAT